MFFRFIKYLYKSVNQHGIHSPFVYRWTTQCLYQKKPKNQQKNAYFSVKESDLLYRIWQYFDIKTTKIVAEEPNFPIKNTSEAQTYDAFLVYNLTDSRLSVEEILNKLHNKSILLIYKPYSSAEKIKLWNTIIHTDALHVTIDIFRFGIAFPRREQRKEHFCIRWIF